MFDINRIPSAQLGLRRAPVVEAIRLRTFLNETIFNGKEKCPMIYVMRDDQICGHFGAGNKMRKLDVYLTKVLAAVEQCPDQTVVVFTNGGPQSNHAMQTAMAVVLLKARNPALDVHVELVLMGNEEDHRPYTGNIQLAESWGATIHWTGIDRDRADVISELKKRYEAIGVYCIDIPVGASDEIGSLGYVKAMYEVKMQEQLRRLSFDHVVVPTGSSGTVAGVAVGLKILGLKGKALAITVDADTLTLPRTNDNTNRIDDLVLRVMKSLGYDNTIAESIVPVAVVENYGRGYDMHDNEGSEAAAIASLYADMDIDGTYCGKAFGGLIKEIAKERFESNENILFIMTGGTGSLLATKNRRHLFQKKKAIDKILHGQAVELSIFSKL